MQSFHYSNSEIRYQTAGEAGGTVFLWAHGWGQSHESFKPLAASFQQSGQHFMVDFPGFGTSPPPPDPWGTEEYADAMAAFIKEKIGKKVVWIGHSFGCRVGIQIAAKYPDLVNGLFLIAAAGLKRNRPLHKKAYLKSRVLLYKALKRAIPLGVNEDWLKSKFGAADYRNASGVMRNVFVKTVNENLSNVATKINCPVTLLYGTKDTETPLEIGERLNKLIPGSHLVALDGQDHYSVLAAGRHQTAHALQEFLEELT